MARRKEDPPKGSPAWMNTFADLMNLLLCFFVMLFSMSSVNEEKFEKVIASFQSTFSILPGGGASIGEGELISSGISQLENFDSYYNQQLSSQSDGQTEEEKDITEAYEQQELEESEDMAQQLENALSQYGIQDDVEVDFNAEYVTLNMNGALLFDSASAELRDEAYPLVNKLGKILVTYDNNIIEVEGHTDNVPIHSSKYEDNNVLSMYRALAVANYLRDTTTLDPAYIKSSGRGEYVPIADNATPEGRARNRRVEIKIYNSYNSNVSGTSTDDTGTETPADAALSTETVTDTPALVLVNLILTAVLAFSVIPQTKKSNELIDQVCAAINIELEGGQNKDSSAVPIEEIAVYNITDNFTVNLADNGDGKKHYAVFSVGLSVNKTSESYATYGGDEMTELTDKETIIRSDINTVVAKYTEEEFNADGQKAVKEEILSKMQDLFGSDYIVGVNFSSVATEAH